MTYHQSDGTITSSATDMPERMRLGKDSRGGLSTFAAHEDSQTYHRADAPLTPAEAMARCPEVAALVRAADYARGGFSWTSRARNRLTAALAPFTKGSDGTTN